MSRLESKTIHKGKSMVHECKLKQYRLLCYGTIHQPADSECVIVFCVFTWTVTKWNYFVRSAATLSHRLLLRRLRCSLTSICARGALSVQEIHCCVLSPSREALYCKQRKLRSIMKFWCWGKQSGSWHNKSTQLHLDNVIWPPSKELQWGEEVERWSINILIQRLWYLKVNDTEQKIVKDVNHFLMSVSLNKTL